MVLDKIVAHKREDVSWRKAEKPLAQLEEQAERVDPPRDFRAALRGERISLIAEVKRASPSKGDILPDVDAVELAAVYDQAGASAISVLTDERFFKGNLHDLTAVHRNLRLPCLRKEFIIDPYQIYEARAAEADAILLIVRILTDKELAEMHALATNLGMAVLVETHSEEEIARAIGAGAHIIGINNRDLDTLEVNVETTLRLKAKVPGGHTLVSESGIYTGKQVRLLEQGGVDAILVGESLLTSKNIAEKIGELLGSNHAG